MERWISERLSLRLDLPKSKKKRKTNGNLQKFPYLQSNPKKPTPSP
jgi:hypothetical protein